MDRPGVPDDDPLLAGAGDRDVELPPFFEEADLVAIVRANQRDGRDLLLAALEAVDGIDF